MEIDNSFGNIDWKKMKQESDIKYIIGKHYDDYDDDKREELAKCLNLLCVQNLDCEDNINDLNEFRSVLQASGVNDKFKDCLTAINFLDMISFSSLFDISELNEWKDRNKFSEDNYNETVMINIGISSHLVFYTKDAEFYVNARDNDLEVDANLKFNFDLSLEDNISLVLARIGIYKIFYSNKEKEQLNYILSGFKINNTFREESTLCIA